jgi:phosphopantetheinyl transferase
MELVYLKKKPLIALGHDCSVAEGLNQRSADVILRIRRQLTELFSECDFICSLDKADQFILSRLIFEEMVIDKSKKPILCNQRDRAASDFGRPFIKEEWPDGTERTSSRQISISHRSQFAMIGLGEQELGVDLEIVEECKDTHFEIAAFTPLERQWVDSFQCLEGNRTQEASANRGLAQMFLWTAKEAVSKCNGTGLQISLQDIEIKFFDTTTEIKSDPLRETKWLRFHALINGTEAFRGESTAIHWKTHLLVTSVTSLGLGGDKEPSDVI